MLWVGLVCVICGILLPYISNEFVGDDEVGCMFGIPLILFGIVLVILGLVKG